MICDKCKEAGLIKTLNPPRAKQLHKQCKDINCPCQHREAELLPDGTLAPKGVKRDVMR